MAGDIDIKRLFIAIINSYSVILGFQRYVSLIKKTDGPGGIKIGNRWRFYKAKINELLTETAPTVDPTPTISFDVLPPTCLQGMQSVTAEAIGIGAIITDAAGDPLTQMSNPSHFCKLINESKKGKAACLEHFSQIARQADATFPHTTCHAGLHCFGAPIMINGIKTAVDVS